MIRILDYTAMPLTHIGNIAKVCYKSESDPIVVAKDCIASGHHRVLEFAHVTLELDEVSARVVREWYTSIVGTSRLQESTRYVNMDDFKFYIPESIMDNYEALATYEETMEHIRQGYMKLEELGIPREDCANVLPLGSHSRFVIQINLRALLHMFGMRLCRRALKEYRDTMIQTKKIVRQIDEEWDWIMENYAKPKCLQEGRCTETHSCKNPPKD